MPCEHHDSLVVLSHTTADRAVSAPPGAPAGVQAQAPPHSTHRAAQEGLGEGCRLSVPVPSLPFREVHLSLCSEVGDLAKAYR